MAYRATLPRHFLLERFAAADVEEEDQREDEDRDGGDDYAGDGAWGERSAL